MLTLKSLPSCRVVLHGSAHIVEHGVCREASDKADVAEFSYGKADEGPQGPAAAACAVDEDEAEAGVEHIL